MNYNFPLIAHIDDVLPAIEGASEFGVYDKGDYKIINYHVMGNETFPPVKGNKQEKLRAALRRECRGLIFAANGRIINRRYHKFFNVGEREEVAIDLPVLKKEHWLLDKLDGSMISPCLIGNHIRWMSKMGITDTAMQAEVFVAIRPNYLKFANHAINNGQTLLFEWCSTQNRVVIEHINENLILTGIRDNYMGHYTSYEDLCRWGEEYNIPIVGLKASSFTGDLDVDSIRKLEDVEGYVARYHSGHMVKIKTDWYCKIHKVKSMLESERALVELILDQGLDDVIPVLENEDVQRMRKFEADFLKAIEDTAKFLFVKATYIIANFTKKEFALSAEGQNSPSSLRGQIFKLYEANPITLQICRELVIQSLKKNLSTIARYEEFVKTCLIWKEKNDATS